jgi:hypothetical protein
MVPPFFLFNPLCLYYNWFMNLVFPKKELKEMGTITN